MKGVKRKSDEDDQGENPDKCDKVQKSSHSSDEPNSAGYKQTHALERSSNVIEEYPCRSAPGMGDENCVSENVSLMKKIQY